VGTEPTTKRKTQSMTTQQHKCAAANGGVICLAVAVILTVALPIISLPLTIPLVFAALVCGIVAIAQNCGGFEIMLLFATAPIAAQIIALVLWAAVGGAAGHQPVHQNFFSSLK
jgi:hypothetical protein